MEESESRPSEVRPVDDEAMMVAAASSKSTPVRTLALLAALCACGFAAITIWVQTGGDRPGVDHAVAAWIASHRGAIGIELADAMSLTGSVVGIVPLGLAVAFILYKRDGWGPVVWLAIACVGATSWYLAFNFLWKSDRPPVPLRVWPEVGYSFPSGHSTQAIVFWPMVAVLLVGRGTVRLGWLVVAIGIVLLIGGSRIYLDAHWTLDVGGGYLLGLTWLFAVLAYRGTRARWR